MMAALFKIASLFLGPLRVGAGEGTGVLIITSLEAVTAVPVLLRRERWKSLLVIASFRVADICVLVLLDVIVYAICTPNG
jgi:hypothetical protein